LPATGDVLALFSNQPGKTVHRLCLVSPQPSGFAEAKMRITFSAVHRPAPLTGRVPRGYPRTVFTQVPDATEPEDPGVQLYHDLPTHYMHAPASMTFNLTGDERAIDFSFGIDEGAYLNGKTNGVEFFVELQREGGATQEIFRRYLRPMNVPGDRGLQQAHVALPADAGAGAKLVVRTGPGEFNDGGWDWSFVTHVNIERANAK
jgi:hypothetical protein